MKRIIFFTLSAFLFFGFYSDSSVTLKGVVVDDSGEVLIGASVLEKGTSNGTITDIDGRFTITVSSEKSILMVSYTGYANQEYTAKSGVETHQIVLNAGILLDECVVVGQGVMRKQSVTMSVATVNSKSKSKKRKRKSSAANAFVAPKKPINQIPSSTNHNTEDYNPIAENQFLEVAQNPLSTFSIDVDAASYSNMRRYLNQKQLPPKDAIRIEELLNYFDYDYPQPRDQTPFEIITEVSDCPWAEKHQLLHIGLQGKKISTDNLPPSNLVFLIDVSGSMSAPNKLPLLQESFKLLVNNLRKQDKVAIVVYAGAAGQVLPPTPGNQKQVMLAAIDNLSAGGSTAGGQGIELAYKIAMDNFQENGNNRIILATDGDFNVGVSSDGGLVEMIEEKRKSGVYLTVLGFGMGNYKDNKMQQLADKGNGNHAYIDNINEAKKTLVSEFGGTLFTIAKDVKLQLEFNPKNVQAYRLIGYENRMLNKEDFNDDAKDAGELGAGHTVTALYEIIPDGVDSEFINAVDRLKYQKAKKGNSTKLSDELLTIKLRYKNPKESKSNLLNKVVNKNEKPSTNSSDNFLFSAAVAECGLLLRDSPLKGSSNFAQAIERAKTAKGLDVNGYRQEFIELMQAAEMMSMKEVAGK